MNSDNSSISILLNNRVFFCDKNLLINKSKFFENFLNDRWTKTYNENGCIILDEHDSDTFTLLLYVIKHNSIPKFINTEQLNLLKQMILYYMVDVDIDTYEIEQRYHVYYSYATGLQHFLNTFPYHIISMPKIVNNNDRVIVIIKYECAKSEPKINSF